MLNYSYPCNLSDSKTTGSVDSDQFRSIFLCNYRHVALFLFFYTKILIDPWHNYIGEGGFEPLISCPKGELLPLDLTNGSLCVVILKTENGLQMHPP